MFHSQLTRQFLLRRDITFLNHGSFGACPRPVFEVYQRWQRELEAQPVEFLGRRIAGLLAEARATLGNYVGAANNELTFVPNATQGINIVARSLDLAPGDEVLGTDHEYGAVARTWRHICGLHGAHYRVQPIPLPVADPDEVVEQIWAGVTTRTKALVVSHITSPTALTLPVEALCRRAREAGVLSIVDGAHVPGQRELDLRAVGADFYAGNCHKWLCAPKGAGFLYARPEVQPLLRPLVVSWGYEPEEPGPSPFIDLFGWTGTDDYSAYLSVPAAIAFQAEYDWAALRRECHELLLDASRQVGELTGLPPISPDTSDWWSQMRTLPLPPCDARSLKTRLWDEFHVEVPIVTWNDQPFVRISIQAYNTANDVGRLVEGLRRLLVPLPSRTFTL